MGRPKKLSDDECLEQAFDVISREGFESFTLEQVGRAVGLSPAALLKRFGTKEELRPIDVERVAFTLEALIQGAIFQFGFLERRGIENHLQEHVQTFLEPYRKAIVGG